MDRGETQIAKIKKNAPSETGAWTSVARFSDHCGAGQVGDVRSKKGMGKISAVVDVRADATALPENMTQWIPLKPGAVQEGRTPETSPPVRKCSTT